MANERTSVAGGLSWRVPTALRTVAITVAAPLPLGAANADSTQAGLAVAAIVQPSCQVSSRAVPGAPPNATVSCSAATPVSISVDRTPTPRAAGETSPRSSPVTRVTVTY